MMGRPASTTNGFVIVIGLCVALSKQSIKVVHLLAAYELLSKRLTDNADGINRAYLGNAGNNRKAEAFWDMR